MDQLVTPLEGRRRYPSWTCSPPSEGIAGSRGLRVSAGRVELWTDCNPERPPAARTALLRAPSEERAGSVCTGAGVTYPAAERRAGVLQVILQRRDVRTFCASQPLSVWDECLRTSRELLRSVSQLVSPDNPRFQVTQGRPGGTMAAEPDDSDVRRARGHSAVQLGPDRDQHITLQLYAHSCSI